MSEALLKRRSCILWVLRLLLRNPIFLLTHKGSKIIIMSKRFEKVQGRRRHFTQKAKDHRYYGAPPAVRRGGARFENVLERDERRLAREDDED